MPNYKILTVTPFFPPDVGGITNHVLNLNIRLAKLGNNITIVAPKRLHHKISPHTDFKEVFRINSTYLPGWPYQTLRSVSIPIDFGIKIESIIQKGDFDFIHVHGHHYPISWLAINFAHKYSIPSILTLHGMYALNPNVLGGRSRIENFFNRYLFTKILSKTTAVIGLTAQITSYAKQFGKESIKYFTIPNGVDTAIYIENMNRKNEFRKKYQINKDRIVILFCGRFEQVKGIIEFANAVKNIVRNKGVEVIIVGGGSQESFVRSILRDTDGIHLLSWQPAENIHELYIVSDIFVIPSKFEALPLTVIEAMNAGLHIVYTPVGGIPDILSEYSSKTVLKVVSSDEIESVLNILISHFPIENTVDDLTYAQKFDWNNVVVNTMIAYAECADV